MTLYIQLSIKSGESGIRTHAPLRTNGFQDRLVMTTSISLQTCSAIISRCFLFVKNFFIFLFQSFVFNSEQKTSKAAIFRLFLLFSAAVLGGNEKYSITVFDRSQPFFSSFLFFIFKAFFSLYFQVLRLFREPESYTPDSHPFSSVSISEELCPRQFSIFLSAISRKVSHSRLQKVLYFFLKYHLYVQSQFHSLS